MSEKLSPSHSQIQAVKRRLSAPNHPEMAAGDVGSSCRDQGSAPAVHTSLKPPDIGRELSLTRNSGKFLSRGAGHWAEQQAGGQAYPRHPAALRHSKCAHKGLFTSPGSGLYPHWTLTFMNLPRGKLERFDCAEFLNYGALCVFS